MLDQPEQDPARSVTIIDVARESGVSYSTVSRVLNGYEYVKESTRRRVLEAAERLGYVANVQARSLAGGHSRIVGLLVPGLDNDYIGEIIRGIDEELARNDYDLMLYTTHRRVGKESEYVKMIANGLTDGLLLVVPLIPSTYVDILHQQRFPYVLIDQSENGDTSSVVNATNWQGAYDATRYLVELGHRRIGFISGLMQISSAVERLEGYKSALDDSQISFDEALVKQGNFWQPSGYAAAQELLRLESPPSAIFSSNDLMAFGAMQAIRDAGLDIPGDISIIGFDDIPMASMVHPKLTTVYQPLDQMGRVAAKLLLEQIEDPQKPARRITLGTQLIIRDSCRSFR
jgi:LacI family transcriptional regulator